MQKRLLQWMMSLMLIISLFVPNLASAQTDGELVKVRLVGLNGSYEEQFLKVGPTAYTNTAGESVQMDKPTAMGALVEFAKSRKLSYEAQTTAYGVYVKQIAGVEAKAVNPNTGWSVYVNGQPPQVGADSIEVKTGDVITWTYLDFTKTLYPKINFSTTTPKVGEEITVTVTAEQTTYDENWNAKTEIVPVEGADVFWIYGTGGSSDTPMPKTDKNGVAKITPEIPGLISVSVYKDNENGVADLINSGELHLLVGNPDANYQDLNGYGWAKSSIAELTAAGIIDTRGTNFAPGQAVTREELAKTLALSGDLNLGGNAYFTDVKNVHNTTAYIQTAARLGYMTGDAEGSFRPSANLKREEFAVVLTRFVGVAVTDATNATALNFSDSVKISPWALPYVKAAVANGLLVGDSEGTFRPQASLNRAEVATALANAMNKAKK